ncbi:30S ribosomal protein S1 [Planococcus glaciei]|uniref:30S ribosomal protein S1 n=1 Tax=Planococcus glaciei TaxID=459472 RepID=A0A1G8A7I7_9BACL|nr:30S ribosomal protein S1 [Planococcus glaciei]ETP70681.1 30S ribosomal protein S1 [Planococcus glaciei CHR43]KOF11244.1 30S ribosomal protein S1 [Planococcus glaciei]MBX0313889.1 30S ribosomal protein S1 [Planococcus glaciei]QKX52423.1 30S ribosomal protein S1 [Planococcus glaciei]SDH16836.1 small subunit ribosomal protein S1 [Planococcus glaciei]
MSEEMNEMENRDFQTGDRVKGIVTNIEEKAVTVTIEGAPFDGVIPISELSSLHIEKASDSVQVGDELDLVITKVEDENFVLSKRKVDAEQAWDELEKKFASGEIIESEVKDVVKGGLVVDLGVRGFVPASLVEDYFVESFEDYKGKVMTFKIVEMEKENNRLILSHRAVVELEKESQKEEVMDTIHAGDVLKGKVQRIASFGAFVDIGGVDGLVHISQLSHEHVEKVSDVVTEGQEVTVKVLSVDRDSERISLSIKDTLPGPWDAIEEKAPKGSVHDGKVKRIVSYGAFVEVLPGVEGLVHISQIAHKHIATPNEVLSEGQEVQVKVLEVNKADKRLSLSIKELQEKEKEQDYSNYEMPEESSGFSISDVIGDKLKGFKSE